MKKQLFQSLALAAILSTAACNGEFMPAKGTTYAPHSESYVAYVNSFKGSDTHVFETGSRSFVMRGTPAFGGNIDPWYDWQDVSADKGRARSLATCGSCNLPMGGEADVLTRNLAGYSAHLDICYDVPAKAPTCFKGAAMAIGADAPASKNGTGKDWKKLSVSVPEAEFRTLSFTKAHLRLVVDGAPTGYKGSASEGVIWADNFHYQLANVNKDGALETKASQPLWPDDYKGPVWQNNGFNVEKTYGTPWGNQ
ncbi:MAG: hypothetical protein PW788_04870 [Micavibrio sp.]|nr:hypothetical protein [Micavibrio sp.]